MSDERIRTNITLPKYHHDWLKLWAWAKGTGFTTLAGNIVAARVEANRDDIIVMLSYRAAQMGITVDDLIAQILSE
ncbi:hypothetical protein [Limnospira platensis]|uniref:hypothetical protein n=1 Tax=Limnospira platensis TaxID=118562 RepID=UPI003D6EAEAD